jgi:hypothetical protein
MPGFDQNGPMGRGPITGWRMGRYVSSDDKARKQESATQNDVKKFNKLLYA